MLTALSMVKELLTSFVVPENESQVDNESLVDYDNPPEICIESSNE